MTRPPVRGDDDFTRPRHAAPDDAWDDEGLGPDPGAGDAGDPADDDWDDRRGGGGVAYDPEAGVEYEELRPPASRMRKAVILGGVVLALLVFAAGGAAVLVRGRLDPSGPPGAEVRFTVPTGTSANAVASLLEDEGIIDDAQVFRWYLRYKGVDGFLAGDYLLNENMAAWEVLAGLSRDPLPADAVRFTVPEGLTVAEVPANVVDDIPGFDIAVLADLLAGGTIRPAILGPEHTSLEGFLFPDTYDIELGGGEAAVLGRMAQQFDAVAAEIGLVERAAALGRTPYEIVTIASLIQEEYGIVEEMPKISRVIYNRLEIGEPLGIDATSRYEAVLAGRDRDDLDFESDSPYNTRRNAGLPPTPIALPGRAALEAALAPVEGPWIFYVRDPDASRTPPGGHFFTDSAREFARVKAECEEAGLGCG